MYPDTVTAKWDCTRQITFSRTWVSVCVVHGSEENWISIVTSPSASLKMTTWPNAGKKCHPTAVHSNVFCDAQKRLYPLYLYRSPPPMTLATLHYLQFCSANTLPFCMLLAIWQHLESQDVHIFPSFIYECWTLRTVNLGNFHCATFSKVPHP